VKRFLFHKVGFPLSLSHTLSSFGSRAFFIYYCYRFRFLCEENDFDLA